VPNELSGQELRRLARLGAQARLEQIDMERRAILHMFPDLQTRGRRGPAPAREATSPRAKRAAPRRRRRKMSPAERRAVSERMKKYWAERRKAKK